jgi:hypothetical protein
MGKEKRGDPEGRRLAQQRAVLLSEAGRVALVLEALIDRANYDTEVCKKLVRDLAKSEELELHRGYGRIESRKRFKKKGTGAPLLERRSRNLLYIDESGKSVPQPLTFQHPPFFALGAVAMQQEEVDNYCIAADEIKLKFFGRKDFSFHEPLIRHRENDDRFGVNYHFGGDVELQQEFDLALDELVEQSKFEAFGVGVRKAPFQKEFIETGVDPYLPTDVYPLAVLLLLERYIDFLAHESPSRFGRITFESQGPREDAYPQFEYARVLMGGSQFVPDGAFRDWLETGLRFEPKPHASNPMELSDMLSRDLYEWIRDGCSIVPKRWGIFSEKIYCRGDGRMGKFGVKVFPDSDIRELIDAHRIRCGASDSRDN